MIQVWLLYNIGNGDFKEISVSESAFFAPGDSKIISLKSKNDNLLIIANNDDRLQIFR